jgi:hypothetical protein
MDGPPRTGAAAMTMAIGQSHGARYYFLSYASAPKADERFAGDPWVRRFYHDLNAAIKGRPGDRLWLPGFADFTVESPRDRPNQRRIALAEAEVFVPLYSPEYLNREELRQEREAFRRRMANAGRPAEGDNLLPILWAPCPSASHVEERDRALAVAPNIRAYAEHGMSALCRHRLYHSQYQTIMVRLAEHIVDIAERFPMSPGALVQDPVDAPHTRPSEVPFLAVIIAPESEEGRRDRAQHNGYFGTRAAEWRPFSHGAPVIRDVETAVHRMRMPIKTAEFVPDVELFANCPGLIMIDPCIVATPDGQETLRRAVSCLRSWVSVAILVDEHGAGRRPAEAVINQLREQFRDADRVDDHAAWQVEVNNLVERARRRFLADRQAFPPAGSYSSRPRLFEGRPPPAANFDEQPGPGRME